MRRRRLTAVQAQVAMAVTVSFLFSGGLGLIAPALPLIVDGLGISLAQSALVLSAYTGGRIVFGLPAGLLSDRVSARAATTIACLMLLASSVIAITAQDLPVLLVARVIQGAASALCFSATLGFVIDVAPKARVGRYVTVHQSVTMMGASIAPVVGGISGSLGGFRGPFYVYGACGLMGAVFATLAMGRASRPVGRRAVSALGVLGQAKLTLSILRDPIFLTALVGGLALYWTRSGVRTTVLPLVAVDVYELSPVTVGFVLTSAALGSLAVMGHAASSVDRIGWWPIMKRSVAASAVVILLLALPVGDLGLFGLAFLLGMATGYSGVIMGVAVADAAPEEVRRSAVSIQRLSQDLGLLAGPVTAAWIIESWGFRSGFVVMGLIVGATLAPMLVLRRRAMRLQGAA